MTHARKLKNKYFTNTDRTVLHLNYTKMLIIKDSFVPIFMMNVMTEFSLVFFPFCGRNILTSLSFGFICISIVRLSRVGSSYLDMFSKEGWYCIQIYHVWEGYLRKIPVERRQISRAECRAKFSLKTGIFRQYPSQTWSICLFTPNII